MPPGPAEPLSATAAGRAPLGPTDPALTAQPGAPLGSPAPDPLPARPARRTSGGLGGDPAPTSGAGIPAVLPPPGPGSTGPLGLSPAFPLTPDEPAPSRRSLRAVSPSSDGGPATPARTAGAARGARPAPYAAGTAAAAAAVPLPYEASSSLPGQNPPEPPERSRLGDPVRRRDAGVGSATSILPAPGLRAAPPPAVTGEPPRVGAEEGLPARSAVRALPDPDSDESGRPGRAGRSARRRRGPDPAEAAETAERDVAVPRRPADESDSATRQSARALRAVDSDPDASENTGIHYGFEDEPSLLLQWGAFIAQTLVGAACGLGVWLGFYQLWERWPFYTAPAAGAAMAVMLAVTRSIRRRYGHDLDLLTAVLTVGVGVVLTVLPAAFVLQHV